MVWVFVSRNIFSPASSSSPSSTQFSPGSATASIAIAQRHMGFPQHNAQDERCEMGIARAGIYFRGNSFSIRGMAVLCCVAIFHHRRFCIAHITIWLFKHIFILICSPCTRREEEILSRSFFSFYFRFKIYYRQI